MIGLDGLDRLYSRDRIMNVECMIQNGWYKYDRIYVVNDIFYFGFKLWIFIFLNKNRIIFSKISVFEKNLDKLDLDNLFGKRYDKLEK